MSELFTSKSVFANRFIGIYRDNKSDLGLDPVASVKCREKMGYDFDY